MKYEIWKEADSRANSIIVEEYNAKYAVEEWAKGYNSDRILSSTKESITVCLVVLEKNAFEKYLVSAHPDIVYNVVRVE